MSQGRQADKNKFDVTNFLLFAYQPISSFYYLPFDKRLELLEQNIKLAAQQFKDAKLPPTAKALFVAPEYLFKDV